MKVLDMKLNEKGKLKWGDCDVLCVWDDYAHHVYVVMPQ
jgi:hypothetical protein